MKTDSISVQSSLTLYSLLLVVSTILSGCAGGTTPNTPAQDPGASTATPQKVFAQLPDLEFSLPDSLAAVDAPTQTTSLKAQSTYAALDQRAFPAVKGIGWAMVNRGNVQPAAQELFRILKESASESAGIRLGETTKLGTGLAFEAEQDRGTIIVNRAGDGFDVAWALDPTIDGVMHRVDAFIKIRGSEQQQTVDLDMHISQAGEQLRLLLATSEGGSHVVQRLECTPGPDGEAPTNLCDGTAIESFFATQPLGSGEAFASRSRIAEQRQFNIIGWGEDGRGGVWTVGSCFAECESLSSQQRVLFNASGREYYGSDGALVRHDIGLQEAPIVVEKSNAQDVRALIDEAAPACVENGPPKRLELSISEGAESIADIDLVVPGAQGCTVPFDLTGDGSADQTDFGAAFANGELGWKVSGGSSDAWVAGDVTYVPGRITAADSDAGTVTLELVRLYTVPSPTTLMGEDRFFQALIPIRELLPVASPAVLYEEVFNTGEATTYEGSMIEQPRQLWVDLQGDGVDDGEDVGLQNTVQVLWRDGYFGTGAALDDQPIPTLRVSSAADAALEVPDYFTGTTRIDDIVRAVDPQLASLETDLDNAMGMSTPPVGGVPRSRLSSPVPGEMPVFDGLR